MWRPTPAEANHVAMIRKRSHVRPAPRHHLRTHSRLSRARPDACVTILLLLRFSPLLFYGLDYATLSESTVLEGNAYGLVGWFRGHTNDCEHGEERPA